MADPAGGSIRNPLEEYFRAYLKLGKLHQIVDLRNVVKKIK